MEAYTTPDGLTHKMALMTSDLRLHYVTAGEGDCTIVLLHRFPQTWKSWRRMIPLLTAAGLQVIAPDYRGAATPLALPVVTTSERWLPKSTPS